LIDRIKAVAGAAGREQALAVLLGGCRISR
jgi:hypothetical protein